MVVPAVRRVMACVAVHGVLMAVQRFLPQPLFYFSGLVLRFRPAIVVVAVMVLVVRCQILSYLSEFCVAGR